MGGLDNKPLDKNMDNTIAYQLGSILSLVEQCPAGDNIDKGLILCRLLKESGFSIIQHKHIMEYCYKCQKETESTYLGGVCKICDTSRTTPKYLEGQKK